MQVNLNITEKEIEKLKLLVKLPEDIKNATEEEISDAIHLLIEVSIGIGSMNNDWIYTSSNY